MQHIPFNMNKLLKNLLLPVISVVIFSCNSQVDVVIDNSSSLYDSAKTTKKVVIDDKITVTLAEDSTTSIKINTGSHTVQINGGEKQKFFVNSNGGMLSLNKSNYVIYKLEYKSREKSGFDISALQEIRAKRVKAVVVIDSFIIQETTAGKSLADSVLLHIMEDEAKDKIDIKTVAFTQDLKKAGGKLYIDKTWDYNMTDSIPETINVTGSNNYLNSNTYKTTILPAKMFLFYAMFDNENYVVKSISEVRSGAYDKKHGKEMEKLQMDF